MWRKFCYWLLHKRMKWTADVTVTLPEKFIICLAPHTSNWDFLIGELYNVSHRLKSKFLMKKEWFFWPMGALFRNMGGVPVYRQKHNSLTETMAEMARKTPFFRLCVTPEGTRHRVEEWKKGFYFIAQKADIPILLFGLDYAAKRIVCTKSIIPSGNVEEDMRTIKLYFKDFTGRKPDNFTTGNV